MRAGSRVQFCAKSCLQLHAAAVHYTYIYSREYKKKRHTDGVSFLLEQGTGIEPAFSAWEADALPMY